MSEPIHHLTRGELIAAGTHPESVASSSAGIALELGAMPLVGSGGMVGLRSPAAIALALSWGDAARERDALATECRTKGDINEALWLENAAAAYTRCARELLQLTGCPDNRQPEPNPQVDRREASGLTAC